jgi:hypothetical protein
MFSLAQSSTYPYNTHQLPNFSYFNPENEGSMFLKVSAQPQDYMAHQPSRPQSKLTPL